MSLKTLTINPKITTNKKKRFKNPKKNLGEKFFWFQDKKNLRRKQSQNIDIRNNF